ncbi:MAG: dTDP-glucose 4,6-dehydratase, partial [Acidobacteriaceae bacterium]|nr:dTDP-glucose 4,6-dehydratase [Acidobacteriaceae bacterium]
VTGGAGFIGSAFVRMALREGWAEKVVNLDKLTYAGNPENLAPVADHPGYRFIQADICDGPAIEDLFGSERPDAVIHFAAESHVDRSIHSPAPAIQTNFNGTFMLLEAARRVKLARFVHVSTDEVYGSIEPPHEADESYPLRASSPYSASKAGSDLLALSYFTTYKLNVSVTRASNNYGPYQFPEKLIPLMISNALEDKALPVYGDGQQIRDWLYVEDHCRAIKAVLEKGGAGEIYNIGGNCSLPNLEVVRRILKATGKPESLITRVTDRPGHDRRYALTNEKLTRHTGWEPQMDFDSGLAATVDWYRTNKEWISHVKSGEYRKFYELNYAGREA